MQRTSDFYDQRPQQLRLEDAELCRGYELYVDSTISEAESKGLISGQGAGGSGADVSIIGAMLTLYYAALRSNTTPPSIQLHRDTSTRGIRLRLQPSTCPPEFLDLFDRWAGAVPQIKGLPRPYQIDLERIICNQPPLTAPPHSNVPAYDSGSCSIYDIAKDLKSIALDILRYRFDPQQRHMISASPRPSLRIPSQPLSRSFPVYGPESPSSEQFASLEISNRLRSQSPVTGGSVTTFLGSNYGQRDSLGGPIQRYKPTSSPLIASGSHIPFAPPASFDALESRSPRGSPTNNTFEQAQSNLPNTIDMTRATNRIAAVISSEMSISDIIDTLGQHDCQNITQMLDISSCSVRPMARGGFGDVYLGKLHDGTAVAVKSIFIRNEGQNQGRKHFKRAARELHTWSRCNHPNVARLLGLAQFRGQIAMVSLWMENGDLRAYVNKYPDVDRFKLCTQVADGLSYLHSIRIVHGDLKGPNVLVSKEGVATIIDLGNAILDEAELQFTNTQGKQRLSIRWTAPEIFAGGGHSYEADVYGLGMTILEALTGKMPYPEKNDRAVMLAVMRNENPARPEECIPINDGWGDALWDLLVRCWNSVPGERPLAAEVYHLLRSGRQSAYASGESTSPSTRITTVISSNMSTSDIIDILCDHGCINLSQELDLASCEAAPRSKGGRSFVYYGRLHDGTPVALKTRTARELYAWAQCRHPHIAQLLGLAEFRGQIAMVSPWMENGDLTNYIDNNQDVDRLSLCIPIADALAYLHSIGVVHGDVKGSNVLISSEGTSTLIDFGNAVLGNSSLQFTATENGPLFSFRWTAPELAEGTEYSAKADVYALGMTILETITGRAPYPDKNDMGAMLAVLHREIPSRPFADIPDTDWGNRLWELLLECWHQDPQMRPEAVQVRDTLISFLRAGVAPMTFHQRPHIY